MNETVRRRVRARGGPVERGWPARGAPPFLQPPRRRWCRSPSLYLSLSLFSLSLCRSLARSLSLSLALSLSHTHTVDCGRSHSRTVAGASALARAFQAGACPQLAHLSLRQNMIGSSPLPYIYNYIYIYIYIYRIVSGNTSNGMVHLSRPPN